MNTQQPEPPPPVAALARHPASAVLPCRICAGARRNADGSLHLRWQLSGALDAVRLAGADKSSALLLPQRGAQLWQQTCFEVFIAIAGAVPYREYNFTAAGHWAAYAFTHYRSRPQPLPAMPPPRLVRRYRAGHLVLDACLPAALLPSCHQRRSLSLGLAAVLENVCPQGEQTRYSYHALQHCGARADFHRRAAFVLTLPPGR